MARIPSEASIETRNITGSDAICPGERFSDLLNTFFLLRVLEIGLIIGFSPAPDSPTDGKEEDVGIGGAGISSVSLAFAKLIRSYPDAFYQGGTKMREFALAYHNLLHPEAQESVCTAEMLQKFLIFIRSEKIGWIVDRCIDKNMVKDANARLRQDKREVAIAVIEAKVICLLAEALLLAQKDMTSAMMPAMLFFSLTTDVHVAQERFFEREVKKKKGLTREDANQNRVSRYKEDKERYPKSYSGIITEYSSKAIIRQSHLVLNSTTLTPIELVIEVLHYLDRKHPELAQVFHQKLSYRYLVFYEIVTLVCRFLRKIGIPNVHNVLPQFVKNIYAK